MFEAFSKTCARVVGSPIFLLAWTIISIAWAVVGAFIGFSETWQFVLLNPLTILTFLALSPLQHTQMVDTAEIKALLKEIAEDLPDVDDRRARDRAAEER